MVCVNTIVKLHYITEGRRCIVIVSRFMIPKMDTLFTIIILYNYRYTSILFQLVYDDLLMVVHYVCLSVGILILRLNVHSLLLIFFWTK